MQRVTAPATRPGPALPPHARLADDFGGHRALEDDPVAVGVDRDGVVIGELPLEQPPRELGLNPPLKPAPERARAERRVVAFAPEQAPGRVGRPDLAPPGP